MSESRNDVDSAYEILEDRFKGVAKVAIQNAVGNVGYGLILVKRVRAGYSDFVIKNILWHELDDVLRTIGAKNSIMNEKKAPR